jgi:hypothetical protein
MSGADPFAHLPGGDWLAVGLESLRRAEPTVPALAVAMAWPRLERLGLLTVAQVEGLRGALGPGETDFELAIYRRLSETLGRGAHGRYLALCEEAESGLNALEREARGRG